MTTIDPILIIGGVGGIGGATAARLVRAGVPVCITARDLDRAVKAGGEIGARGLAVDVLDEASLAAAVSEASGADGRLGGLVYAVGSIPLKALSRTGEADHLEAYRLNVIGAAMAVKHASGALKAGRGAVVLFSSVAATQGFLNHSVIGPAKAAVSGLVVSLAAELAPHVRVNGIAPSLTRTPLAQPILGSEKMAAAIAELHPLGRLGAADDVAALAALLATPDAGWITGQIIGVDGGRGALRVGRA